MTHHPTPITLLFTDIEGSTRLWERDASAMWQALERHNVILAAAIRDAGGHHYKTIGDAFQAAFTDPAAAVTACVAAQQSLAAQEWPETGPLRVRMALHHGPAVQTTSGDYQAPVLTNRLERLLSTGYGGQVLLSAAARAALGERLPAETALLPLGSHRLRDLLLPEEIWQLVIPGLPATFPPLKSLEGYPTNLPQQTTPLIGRDEAVATLRDLLQTDGTRLLTLTGPGGIGKTRLALAAAAESLDAFPDGVFLVALAGIQDAALFLPEIAAVLGVRESGGLSLEESILAYLSGKRLLLVLDNLEQLRPFEDVAEAIAWLMREAPTPRVLATSRAPLRLRAEQEWPVPPLAPPAPEEAPASAETVAALAANPAVALFIDRAQDARPAWSLTPDNAAHVAGIARRLEGVPLALELAAARIRVFSPADIARRLTDALDLLAAHSDDRPSRQQTLRGAIAWSHDLLGFEQQAAFRRLGVFSGGFTIEAAEAVLAEAPDPWIDALDAISILVEQNLLRADDGPDGETRYRMLETIRAFALEHLDAAGEGDPLGRAHATWAERFARDADRHVMGPESAAWLDRYEREHDNFRAAIAWAIAHDPGVLGLRLPEAVWRFWQIRGHYAEGRNWLQRALAAAPDAASALRALALEGLANFAWKQGQLLVAASAYEEALATWRAEGDRGRIASALSSTGVIAEQLGQFDRALALQEEAVAMARALAEPLRLATTLNNLATALVQTGDVTRAAALLEESIAIKRHLEHVGGLAASLTNLAILLVDAGEIDRATAYLEETLAIDRQVGNLGGIADTLGNLAAIASEHGDPARSAALDAEALRIRQDLGDLISIAYGLESIAATVARAGFPRVSARLFGAAQRLREEIRAPLPPAEQERYERGLATPRQALGEDAFAQEWQAGRDLTVEAAIAEALQTAREAAAPSGNALRNPDDCFLK